MASFAALPSPQILSLQYVHVSTEAGSGHFAIEF